MTCSTTVTRLLTNAWRDVLPTLSTMQPTPPRHVSPYVQAQLMVLPSPGSVRPPSTALQATSLTISLNSASLTAHQLSSPTPIMPLRFVWPTVLMDPLPITLPMSVWRSVPPVPPTSATFASAWSPAPKISTRTPLLVSVSPLITAPTGLLATPRVKPAWQHVLSTTSLTREKTLRFAYRLAPTDTMLTTTRRVVCRSVPLPTTLTATTTPRGVWRCVPKISLLRIPRGCA